MADVLIAGAGPAGSLAAILLARAGLRVRLFDRARLPREKLCGDTLNPGALAILSRLGLEAVTAGSLPIDGMLVTDASGVRCSGCYGQGRQGRAIRRVSLDHALVGEAIRAGVDFEDGVLVQSAIVDDGRVRGLRLAPREGASLRLESRLVIAADGGASRIARALGLSRHPDRPRRWAVGAYFDRVAPDPSSDPSSRFGEMHLRRDRYIGVAPVPGDLTNVCVVTADRRALRDPPALLRQTLRDDAGLRERFAAAAMATRPVCLGPLAVESSGSGMPGLLLAGDAAGFIDPMTGDGLRFALRGAELAAANALAALDGEPDRAQALWQARRREFAAKWRFNRMLRTLVGSRRAMQIAALGAKASPSVLERVIRYAGDVGSAA
jgi:menaquinone-9 beta-reductase